MFGYLVGLVGLFVGWLVVCWWRTLSFPNKCLVIWLLCFVCLLVGCFVGDKPWVFPNKCLVIWLVGLVGLFVGWLFALLVTNLEFFLTNVWLIGWLFWFGWFVCWLVVWFVGDEPWVFPNKCLVIWFVCLFVCLFVVWFVGDEPWVFPNKCLVIWLVWFVCLLVGWLVGWLVVWLVGRLLELVD